MTILISHHAEIRTRERFPLLAHVPSKMIHDILRGIADTGSKIESYVTGDYYRRGVLSDGTGITLHVKLDRYNESNRVITTVFTDDQVLPGARKEAV